MASYCNLCDKKINSVFGAFYSINNVLICEDCYCLYKKVLHSVSDAESFESNLAKFKNQFSEKEKFEKIETYLKSLHEEKMQEKLNKEKFEKMKEQQVEETENKVTPSNNSIDMFSNIGGKIKTLAQVITWTDIILSVIIGFVLMSMNGFTGFLIALLGSLGS